MSRYVVQRGPGDYVVVYASSPRKAAREGAPGCGAAIVWYRARSSWACWAESPEGRTRYLGKVDERVAALLAEEA